MKNLEKQVYLGRGAGTCGASPRCAGRRDVDTLGIATA
jgi:hypothetical protein